MSPPARWCPTPEQLMILEEMYRSGMRTPNASQIQRIAAHLSFYGKIEGKNVFYWFQNHKARDRQKLRRKLPKQLYHQRHHHDQQNHHRHHSHRLLHYLDSPPPPPPSPLPPPPPHQQLSHHSSVGILPGGRVEEGGSKQTWSCTWRVNHLPERFEMDKSMPGTYGRDWMMMHDVGPAAPCFNQPFQTLELFPITATALKDQYCTPSKHIP